MPERWIQEVVGDEARARAGFEDELARELQRGWRGNRTPWRPIAWGAAAAAVLIGAIALIVSNDDPKQIAPATTLPPVVTTQPAPSTTVAQTTAPTSAVETTTPPTTAPPSTTIDTSNMTGVQLYLASLANGDYDTAAQLLNEGGLSLEDRADVRPLFRPEFGLIPEQTSRDALAAALQRWCARALCGLPAELNRADDQSPLVATYVDGLDSAIHVMYSEFVFEGQPGVYGLPPLMPEDGSAADLSIIDCPTGSDVREMAWADLDGDGWSERIIGRLTGGLDEDTGIFEVSVCGTTLQVTPTEVTGAGLSIYPVNLVPDDGDYVLLGTAEGDQFGDVYAFDDGALAVQQGPDGPASWRFPFSADNPTVSFGCAIFDAGAPTRLVTREITFIGGNELFDSSSVDVTSVDVFTGETLQQTFTLPEQEAEAGDAVIGYCDGLPVRVD